MYLPFGIILGKSVAPVPKLVVGGWVEVGGMYQ